MEDRCCVAGVDVCQMVLAHSLISLLVPLHIDEVGGGCG